MPVYCYECPECGRKDELLRRMAQSSDPAPCPACGNGMRRDYLAEHVHSPDQGYQTPLLSDALGIHPSQIPEAQQRFPHHKFAPDGRMVLESHSERNRVMKELGFHDNN